MKNKIAKIILLMVLAIFYMNFVLIYNVSFANAEETINMISNLIGGVVSIIYGLKKLQVIIIAFCANLLGTFIAKIDGVLDSAFIVTLSPFHIFFNKLQITDVNFFDLSINQSSTIYKIRVLVSGWFYIMRLISVSILLLILIYVGIRMALSSLAEDKAKYKKMLADWVTSIALIFVLQYICVFTVYANNAIVKALEVVANGIDITDVMADIALLGALGVGINSISATLVYCLLTFQTLGFLLGYINRMLKVGFLIIISPLISITYSIDKMGDGKSQALDLWLKEFVYTILIQPFHCIIYIALIGVAFGLLTNNNGIGVVISSLGPEYNQLANGILAILCVKFVKDAEEIVRKIFGFKDDNSLTSMAAGMAMTMLAVNKAKGLGKSARKMTTKMKGLKDNNLLKSVGKDFEKLGNRFPKIGIAQKRIGNGLDSMKKGFSESKVGQKMNSFGNKMNSLGQKAGEKFKGFNNRLNGGLNKLKGATSKINGAYNKFKGTKIGNFIAKRNSLSSAFGIALGAMAYGSGSTNALSAIGIASAGEKGAQEFMNTSKGTISNGIAENQKKLEGTINDEITDIEKDLNDVADDLEDTDRQLEQLENEEDDTSSEEGEEQEESDTAESSDEENPENSSKDGQPSESSPSTGSKVPNDKSERIKELKARKGMLEARKSKLEKRKEELISQRDSLQSDSGTLQMFNELDAQGGKYDNNSKELQRLLSDLRAALANIGQEDKFQSITQIVTIELSMNPKEFNLNDVLRSTLDYNESGDEKYKYDYAIVRERARAIERHTLQSNISQGYQVANSVSIEPGELAASVNKKLRQLRENDRR